MCATTKRSPAGCYHLVFPSLLLWRQETVEPLSDFLRDDPIRPLNNSNPPQNLASAATKNKANNCLTMQKEVSKENVQKEKTKLF